VSITYPPEMLPRQEDGDGEVWIVPADDSFGCWQLGQAIYRERGVRAGLYPPVTEAERRQAAEGPVPVSRYDAVGGPVPIRFVGGHAVRRPCRMWRAWPMTPSSATGCCSKG
jgi:hypothetical protein